MLTAMSCSDADNTVVPGSSVMMSFCGEDIQTDTRASFTTSMTSFGLSCSVYSSSATASSAAFGNYFLNKEISNYATTEYFWPGSGKKCSFYAYYPCGNSNIILNSTTSSTGSPTYALTIPTDITKQVDFCVAEVKDVAGDYERTVTLPFSHACASISFKIKNTGTEAFTLKSVSFYGVKQSGRYSNGIWSTSGNASTSTSNAMTITSNTSIDGGATLDVSGATNKIIVIPQTIAAETEIFDVLVDYNGEEKHYTYSLSEAFTIEKGSGYTYTLSINCYNPSNGYEYVDLGLPSGNLWATCNVGASNPWDYGLYFAWGETTGYTQSDVTSGLRKFNSSSYKASSISADLTLEQDAAHVNMGGNWRMPTKAEYQELIDNCDATWTDNYNGTKIKGMVFTSKINGNSVFFPAAGYCDSSSFGNVGKEATCWSASWMNPGYAWRIYPHATLELKVSSTQRYVGHQVRGVLPPPPPTPVDLGLPSGLKWADRNIGAGSPERVGLYFAWGETTGYTAEQVKSGERSFKSGSYKAASISTNLTLKQDAAHVNLSGNWRMPTKAEYQELLDNCTATWTDDYNGTGVAGRILTSKTNGNSVFFPAAGYCRNSSVYDVGSFGCCWSASWDSPSYAWELYFNSGVQGLGNDYRYCGRTVRAVCE